MMNDAELEDFEEWVYQKILLKIEIYISKFIYLRVVYK